MRLKVLSVYNNTPTDYDYWTCIDEAGNQHIVDLMIDGGIGPEYRDKLVGRTVECESLTPFKTIACEVQLVEEEDNDN